MRNFKKDKIVLDEWYAHESLDRMYLVMEMFNSYVAEHPFVELTPELKEKAEHVSGILMDMYQSIGKVGLEYEDPL